MLYEAFKHKHLQNVYPFALPSGDVVAVINFANFPHINCFGFTAFAISFVLMFTFSNQTSNIISIECARLYVFPFYHGN